VRNISIFVSDFPYDVCDGTLLEKVLALCTIRKKRENIDD